MGFGDGRGLGISQTDALYASLANPNSLAGSLSFAIQSFTLNGGTQTISATGGANIVIQGSTVSSTIKLPASPSSGQMLELLNAATVNLTLDGNGNNIDGAATVTMSAGYGRTIVYTGANGWRSSCLTRSQADTLYGALAGANTWSATNTFSGPMIWGGQTFTQSASWTGTVSATSGGSIVTVSGTGSGGTLTLPAAPPTWWIVAIQVSSSSSSFTLTAGGTTLIGTTTTQTVTGGSSGFLVFNGASYQPLTFGGFVATNTPAVQTFNNAVNVVGSLSIQSRLRLTIQQFGGAGTITTSGCQVEKTAAGAYTLALPTGPTQGDTYFLFDGFGDALAFNLSVSSSDKAINATAAGGGAVAAVITNYGRATITYDGTAWKLAKG